MNPSTLSRAADRASEMLRQGRGGLAVHIAAEEYGLSKAAVVAELLHRKKLKKEARDRAVKGTGRKFYWQDKD